MRSRYIHYEDFPIDEDKFIIRAPIGSGKSTAIRKWTSSTEDNYIIITPTTNIAGEFFNGIDCKNKILATEEGAFKALKDAIDENVRIVITTFSTASLMLGDLIEEYNEEITDTYRLVIDEAHELLKYTALFHIISEFTRVAIFSATVEDVSDFRIFNDFITVSLTVPATERTIDIYPWNDIMTDQKWLVDIILDRCKVYDKIVVKVESKKICIKLKEQLEESLKSSLYIGNKKEVELSIDGKFINPSDSDIIIATSCIQSGQSIKESNLLSIFVQTYRDTISSVHQFIGRNRLRNSNIELYLRCNKGYNKVSNKEKYRDRYEKKKVSLMTKAFYKTSLDEWQKYLSELGTVNIHEGVSDIENKKEVIVPEEFVGKLFQTKRELYSATGISIRSIPSGYFIQRHQYREEGKKKERWSLEKQ